MTWSARRTRREQAQGGIGSVERKAPWLLKRIKKFNSYHMICGVFAIGTTPQAWSYTLFKNFA